MSYHVNNFFFLLIIILPLAIFSDDFFPNLLPKITIPILILCVYVVSSIQNRILSNSIKKNIYKLLLLVFSLFLIFISLKVINVYDLDNIKPVRSFCESQSQFCYLIQDIFYKFKMYRFITLQPKVFVYIFITLLGLLIIEKNKMNSSRFIKSLVSEPLLLLVFTLLAILMLNQVVTVSERMFELSVMTWNNRSLSFYDRFVPYEFGIEHHGWIYEYGKFVSKHVPLNASIFIPPQNNTWSQEGNKYYFRWFVYPRDLLQSEDENAEFPANADYILISRGGWKNNNDGWPKKSIPKECFVSAYIINRYTLEEKSVSYDALNISLTPDVWGLIQLDMKKESCQH